MYFHLADFISLLPLLHQSHISPPSNPDYSYPSLYKTSWAPSGVNPSSCLNPSSQKRTSPTRPARFALPTPHPHSGTLALATPPLSTHGHFNPAGPHRNRWLRRHRLWARPDTLYQEQHRIHRRPLLTQRNRRHFRPQSSLPTLARPPRVSLSRPGGPPHHLQIRRRIHVERDASGRVDEQRRRDGPARGQHDGPGLWAANGDELPWPLSIHAVFASCLEEDCPDGSVGECKSDVGGVFRRWGVCPEKRRRIWREERRAKGAGAEAGLWTEQGWKCVDRVRICKEVPGGWNYHCGVCIFANRSTSICAWVDKLTGLSPPQCFNPGNLKSELQRHVSRAEKFFRVSVIYLSLPHDTQLIRYYRTFCFILPFMVVILNCIPVGRLISLRLRMEATSGLGVALELWEKNWSMRWKANPREVMGRPSSSGFGARRRRNLTCDRGQGSERCSRGFGVVSLMYSLNNSSISWSEFSKNFSNFLNKQNLVVPLGSKWLNLSAGLEALKKISVHKPGVYQIGTAWAWMGGRGANRSWQT